MNMARMKRSTSRLKLADYDANVRCATATLMRWRMQSHLCIVHSYTVYTSTTLSPRLQLPTHCVLELADQEVSLHVTGAVAMFERAAAD